MTSSTTERGGGGGVRIGHYSVCMHDQNFDFKIRRDEQKN